MELTIITPEKKEHFTIAWLELNTPSGNRIIQPGHIPMIVSLVAHKPFLFSLSDGSVKERIIHAPAFAHITRNYATILTADTCP